MRLEISFAFAFSIGILLTDVACAQAVTLEEAKQQLANSAEKARKAYENLSFEEFQAKVPYIESAKKYLVNGDVGIDSLKKLEEFWRQSILVAPSKAEAGTEEFAIAQNGGLDLIWDTVTRMALTYCVSSEFGARRPAVIEDMEAASGAWEAVAAVDFRYVESEDGQCNSQNNLITFDVRPVNENGAFLAMAFFPNEPRTSRSVLIDESSFHLDPAGALTLRGILRHELGHVLGARHEHTRPEAGKCFEDANWRGVTSYDAFSVMHYPQCKGLGDWTLQLTNSDKSGVACIYGPASGFQIDPSICTPIKIAVRSTELSFGPAELAAGSSQSYDAIGVQGGTLFEAHMVGEPDAPGDADLYLKFDGHAHEADFDCRPFRDDSDESCVVNVPIGASSATLMVHGNKYSKYKLNIKYVSREE